jgi:hypothetical protein
MENDIKIDGTWYGELTYGEENGPDLQNKKLKFRMIIEENDGDITGECIDTEGTGVIPEPASINGFVEDNMISFVKQYPSFYIIDQKGEIKEIPEKEPPEFNYSGYYNPGNDTFEGDWHVVYEIKQLTFGFAEYAISGTWMMKREN